jgi:hypothetical protein
MEQLVFSTLIFQALAALGVLAAAAAEALWPRARRMRYWTVPPLPVMPASVYDLQEAAAEESYPRAA